MSKQDVDQWRQDFPMLQKSMHGHPLIYFDSAATAQKPQAVIDAITHFYRDSYGTVHRAVYELSLQATESFALSRIAVQKFIHAASPEEIIFTRGTTAAINLVAQSFGKAFIQPGDRILISQTEHHSNIVPWQMLCQDRKAVLEIIPVFKDGQIDLETYKRLLEKGIKLVSIAHISNVLGTVNPIKEMTALAHLAGAKVFIDGAQSAPHLCINVQDLDVDFFAFSGHKLYGPTGVGILYGKKKLLNQMPPIEGGGDMIEKVTLKETTYNTLPLKFEAGTPMIAEVIGLGAAIDYVHSVGFSNIHPWEKKLLSTATSKMLELPEVKIFGEAPEKSAIISFKVSGVHSLDLATLLSFKGIAIRSGHHCSQPTMELFDIRSCARASFAFYNTLEEIDTFIAALKKIISTHT